MRKIFVDLEMNQISKEYLQLRTQYHKEIIQIGAVMLDEDNTELSLFNEYVRPEYSSEIDRHVWKLTGITFDLLEGANHFSDVFRRFLSWCGTDYKIFAWSEYDLSQIRNEIEMKSLGNLPGFTYAQENWHNYQKEFGELLQLENPLSLSTAVEIAGLDFSGKQHDALDDARNTAALFALTKDAAKFSVFEQKVINSLRPTTFTLGDLFDFSMIKENK